MSNTAKIPTHDFMNPINNMGFQDYLNFQLKDHVQGNNHDQNNEPSQIGSHLQYNNKMINNKDKNSQSPINGVVIQSPALST